MHHRNSSHRALPLVLAASMACAGEAGPEVSPYDAPDGAPYTAEEVTVETAAGLSLAGTLTLPTDVEAPLPAVVTITGSGRQDRDETFSSFPGYRPFRQIADTLGRRGIATLRLDDRGVGGSDAGPDGATSADFADDIRAAVAYLRSRPEIDPARVGLIGHSEGGVIAPMVAATDTLLAGVVLLAGPAYTLRRVNRFQRLQNLDPDGRLAPEDAERELDRTQPMADEEAAESPWRAAAWEYDPLPTARAVRAPVLILHGESDRSISVDQADTLAAAFREGASPDVTLKTFRNTNHLFMEDPGGRLRQVAAPEVRPVVVGALAEWLVARLR